MRPASVAISKNPFPYSPIPPHIYSPPPAHPRDPRRMQSSFLTCAIRSAVSPRVRRPHLLYIAHRRSPVACGKPSPGALCASGGVSGPGVQSTGVACVISTLVRRVRARSCRHVIAIASISHVLVRIVWCRIARGGFRSFSGVLSSLGTFLGVLESSNLISFT